MPWFLLGWSPLAFGETNAHSQGNEKEKEAVYSNTYGGVKNKT